LQKLDIYMNYYLHLLYIRRFLSFKKNISIGNNIDDVIDAIDTIFVIKNISMLIPKKTNNNL